MKNKQIALQFIALLNIFSFQLMGAPAFMPTKK